MKSCFLAVLALYSLSGCALLERSENRGVECRLRQAGFKVTPTEPAAMAYLPPYEVKAGTKAGRIVYQYADPRKGRLYEGGRAEYVRYRDLAIATQERRVTNLTQIGPRRPLGPLLW